MSLESFGQGKGRNAEQEYRSGAEGQGYDPYNNNPYETLDRQGDVDGSELTPGYEGFQAVKNEAERAGAVPERTDAPEGAFPELNMGLDTGEDSEAVDTEVLNVATLDEGEALTSEQAVASEDVSAVVGQTARADEMRTASLNAEREARLASMEKEVMNPHESTTPATSVQKKGWLQRFFGG